MSGVAMEKGEKRERERTPKTHARGKRKREAKREKKKRDDERFGQNLSLQDGFWFFVGTWRKERDSFGKSFLF